MQLHNTSVSLVLSKFDISKSRSTGRVPKLATTVATSFNQLGAGSVCNH